MQETHEGQPLRGQGRDMGDRERALRRKAREKGGSSGQGGRARSRSHRAEQPSSRQGGPTSLLCLLHALIVWVRPGGAAARGAQTAAGARGVRFHSHLTVFPNKRLYGRVHFLWVLFVEISLSGGMIYNCKQKQRCQQVGRPMGVWAGSSIWVSAKKAHDRFAFEGTEERPRGAWTEPGPAVGHTETAWIAGCPRAQRPTVAGSHWTHPGYSCLSDS